MKPTPAPFTKTVEGTFRPTQVTRAEFVQRWVDHFRQCFALVKDAEQITELDTMKNRIAELAGQQWDRLPS